MDQHGRRRAFHYRRTGDTIAGTQLFHVEYRSFDEVIEIDLPLADSRPVRIRSRPFLFLQLWLISLRRRRNNKIAELDSGFSVSRSFAVDSFIGLFEAHHQRFDFLRAQLARASRYPNIMYLAAKFHIDETLQLQLSARRHRVA